MARFPTRYATTRFFMTAFLAACGRGPQAVVAEAGHALKAHDRAALYATVDVDRFATSLADAVVQRRVGEMAQASVFAQAFASGATSAISKQIRQAIELYMSSTDSTHASLDRLLDEWLDSPVDSARVGKTTVASNSAVVSLSFFDRNARVTRTVSLQLEKGERDWKIVGVPDLAIQLGASDRLRHARIAAMKSDLRNLITAEEAFFSDNHHYAPTVAALGWNFKASDGVTVTIDSATLKGHSSHAIHRDVPNVVCRMQMGFSTIDEGDPVCR